MLAMIVNAIISRLAFVWRIFGSPRIASDEKMITAVHSIWGKRYRVPKFGSGTSTRARKAIVASSGVLVSALVIWLVIVGFGMGAADETDTSAATPTPESGGTVYLTEVAALGNALVAARDNGLISKEITHISRRIQFSEYADAIGESYRADKGLLSASPDTEVWAIAFAGDVELMLITGEMVKYNNLTVVLDAITAEIYRVEAFYGEYETEARAAVWLRPPTPTPVRVPATN
jgi:hypothetical protein